MALFPCFLKIIENIFVTGGGSARFNYMEHYSRCWNWLIIPFFAAFLLMFIASSLWAQDSSKVKFLIGPVVGYSGVGYSTSEFPAIASKPSFFIEQNGNGVSQFFGISAEIPVSSGMDKFLIIEGIYDMKSAAFGSISQTGGDSTINMSASLSYVVMNIGFKYNMVFNEMPSMFGLQASLSFGWAINHTFITRYDSVVFNNSSLYLDTINPHSAISNINGLNKIRIAFRPELTYDIPFLSRWILTPYAGADIPLTKVDNTSRNWTVTSAYVAIALRFAIGS